MSNTSGASPTAAAGNGDGDGLDPQDAAALLRDTTRRARRQLEPFPPLMSAVRAGIALATYGTIWLTVRGQHPYHGPTSLDIPIVLALAAVNLGAAIVLARRAYAGVSGKSKLQPVEILIMALVWIGVFVVMAALPGAGVSREVWFGQYMVAAPLIAAGLAWAGIMAVRANWLSAGPALAAAAIGAASVFGGPVGAWAIAALALPVAILAHAIAVAVRQRAATTRP